MTIYHYTDLNAMTSMLNSRKIWLSHLGFMNDRSEISYGLRESKAILKFYFDSIASSDYISEHMMLEELEKSRLYAMSFSKNKNRLSMWRSYCPKGAGVAIGFNEERLAGLAKKHTSIKYRECKYEKHWNDLITKEMTNYIFAENINDYAREINEKTPSDRTMHVLRNVYSKMLENIPFLKHPDFSEEDEVRLLVNGQGEWVENFRTSGSTLVPYIEIDTGLTADELFDEIIIGPNLQQERCARSVDRYLKSINAHAVRVECSETPFIP